MLKTTLSRRLLIILTVSMLLISNCSNQQSEKTAPITNQGQKWRIAYYQGGPWPDYQQELLSLVDAWVTLGWLEPVQIPPLPTEDDTQFLWQWLAKNARSDYIEFVGDAYWSADWNEETRLANQADCLQHLQQQDYDLILAMGTWAGLDLANDLHSTPTIVMSTSDPIAAGIIKSGEDSGYAHVHARCDPFEQYRKIKIMYDILEFQRVGVVYDHSTEEGKIYAAISDLERLAAEKSFEIIDCDALETNVSQEVAVENTYQCIQELAPQIDAFLVTANNGQNPRYLPGILQPLFDYHVPTWALEGPRRIERGVMLGVARNDMEPISMFYANTIAQVFHGADPGSLPQVFEEPKRIAINIATARLIGYDIPPGLIESADVVFEEIEGYSDQE